MAILFVALAVGIILLIVLLRSIGKNTRYRIKHGKGMEKFTEIVKVVLLFETIIICFSRKGMVICLLPQLN